ncbi:MAG: hypothetical protein LBB10_00125, partial [Bifidobacteriaceae bacterium]|nr:hypothetical protein [Bifidobacteriaceae bacterium]
MQVANNDKELDANAPDKKLTKKPPQKRGMMNRGGGAGVAGEKPANFFGTLKRVLGLLFRDKLRVFIIILTASLGAFSASLGPKLIGNIVNAIFDGIASKMIAS